MKLENWIKRRDLRGRAIAKARAIAAEQGDAAAIEYVRCYGREKEVLHRHTNKVMCAPEETLKLGFKPTLAVWDGGEWTLPKRPQEIYFRLFPTEADDFNNASPGSRIRKILGIRACRWCRSREVLTTPPKKATRVPHVLVPVQTNNFKDDKVYTAKSVYKLLAEILPE